MHLRHISPGSTDWLDAVSAGGDDGGGRGGGKPQGPEEKTKLHAARADGERERSGERRRSAPGDSPEVHET
jgi:hypothetical protein